MKKCTICGDIKPLSEFYGDRRRKDGKQARCKLCKHALHRDYMKRTDGHKKRYRANPVGERERHIVKKYGITVAEYERMLKAQNGKCAICKSPATKTLDIDHCHHTKKVRGLLCTSCNRMLSHAGDNAARLIAGAHYLAKRT